MSAGSTAVVWHPPPLKQTIWNHHVTCIWRLILPSYDFTSDLSARASAVGELPKSGPGVRLHLLGIDAQLWVAP